MVRNGFSFEPSLKSSPFFATPFAQAVCGDWLVEPREHPVHLGEIYLNGEAMYEAKTLDEFPVLLPDKQFFYPRKVRRLQV